MTSTHKLHKSQMLNLFLIASVLIVTPLLSAPLRSKYLYLIANILVVAVGAEAGLISFFFTSPENNKLQSSPPLKPHAIIIPEPSQHDEQIIFSDQCGNNEIVMSEKVVGEEAEERPSIFFIEDQDVRDDIEEEEEESGDRELFHKAETFIGDFYKQLKMQREESWKKLHDIYQKAF